MKRNLASPDVVRRRLSGLLLAGALGAPLAARVAHGASAAIEVWTGPSCGCCRAWIEHLKQAGFAVTSHDGGNADARTRLGVPVRYGSCHTAAIDGYAIEGHVPAADIQRLVAERPDAIGLAVPGMPRGSPGMEVGDVRDPYDVLLIRRDGGADVFARYR